MRALICGGGTAGHIVPGIAIAEEIAKRDRNAEILFVGREGGTENDLTLSHGFNLLTIKVCGLVRGLSVKNAKGALMLLSAMRRSRKIIKSFRPDIVIGTGGYVSWPIVRAAQHMGVPSVIHESNATPGLATRMLAKRCDAVFLNFKECGKHLKNAENIRVVGNPLLKGTSYLTKEEARRRLGIGREDFLLLSFGGSGGAAIINERLIELMLSYSVPNAKFKHIHASGVKYFDKIKSEHPELISGKCGCYVTPFISDMPTHMKAADVVVCRSGAMTVSELAALGTPAVLVPSKNVTDDHQFKNASALRDAGAALLIEEEALTSERLREVLEELRSCPHEREKMRRKLVRFSTPNAKKLILDEIEKILAK